jgi:hypothetical protein
MAGRDTVLICTVGGSHQPIVTAIVEMRPRFVCFICTGRDPATGQPGSEIQITGKGNVIKANRCDNGPSLPNIPAQTGLANDQFEVCLVPSDDLDAAYKAISDLLTKVLQRCPDAVHVADYTGGTKTMTAALVMAALETEDMELRLVTGARADLTKVRDGTESSIVASAEYLRLRRAMAPYLAAWGRYAYGEACQGLATIPAPRHPQLRSDLQIARDLSCAFDAWDRFDHKRALEILRIYQPRVGQGLGRHFTCLSLMTAPDDDPRREAARLWDLWRNAERRAVQGRYDDAVARVYRLLEWTAQWLLRARAAIDTSNLRQESIPDGVRITTNHRGEYQAGLLAAWDLVAHHLDTEAARWVQAERSCLQNHIKMRNDSILAHGYSPVDRSNWERLAEWVTTSFIPALAAEADHAGVRHAPPQLPQQPPWQSDGRLTS